MPWEQDGPPLGGPLRLRRAWLCAKWAQHDPLRRSTGHRCRPPVTVGAQNARCNGASLLRVAPKPGEGRALCCPGPVLRMACLHA